MTALLLEAAYRAHIEEPFTTMDRAETKTRYVERCRPLVQLMLLVPTPVTLTPAGWRIYALEVWVSAERFDLLEALGDRHVDVGWLAEILSTRGRGSVGDLAHPAASRLNEARGALVEVGAVDSVDAVAIALASLDKLSSEEIARLREAI